mmetsp:Transcript_18621/g.28252  ORF Transcript_18621/g.28252 Transcript_18621/m.28252 type:complete len:218 (-) Transcript_18621:1170-1823(-)
MASAIDTQKEIQKLSIDGGSHIDTSIDELDDDEIIEGINFVNYRDESQIESVMRLVGRDLSEPYSVFTYRYFLHRFPQLCIFAVPSEDKSENVEPIGCVVCKIDPEDNDDVATINESGGGSSSTPPDVEKEARLCGYIGMLAVDTSYRRSGIGFALVKRAVRRMKDLGCSSVILETEVSNKAAMKLYEERFGFMREEFLSRYYLNNGDAYRLRLWLK